ncbi:polyribonucleotide nucleotidyltransferase [Fistulifera solaris]|uniref:polyribonucleotide nucleotidyltransferase n=1 Tax=Fistulifera solaris TaxID=1519565 RepID=A0A1Z5JIU5_FISSO|nr:polyribonucleotide nucleotidyltransferase [Fistulifera solaris]|eukprot:GAX13856.1 polyribonucleotide nucleotidyltransferase [Fistulifera solaris]
MRLLLISSYVFVSAVAFSPLHRQSYLRIPTSLSATNGATDEYYSIETTNDGPQGGAVHKIIFHKLNDKDTDTDMPPIVIETGKIGRQAAGAVTLTRGDSVLYATAARDEKPKAEIDFLPLSVEHQERFSSAGLTSGSYNKRDGRAAEHEILTCRLIDRPIRPLVASGWRHETQLLSWVLSYDGIRSCDPLAIVSSATALYLSDVPLLKPVAAVQVGMDEDGSFLLNPTNEQMAKSALHLTVAGTQDAILMIEGAADFLPEEIFLKAVQHGHDAIQILCKGIKEFGETVGITKNLETLKLPPDGLQQRVDELFTAKVDEMYATLGTKEEQGALMSALQKNVVETLEEEFPDESIAIKMAFKDLLSRRMFERAKTTGMRADGRELGAVRRIDIEAGFLPRVHGSALFTRGETQAIATATLGDSGMRQKIDKLDGLEEKRFYLQYSFPPSSVGETGRVGAPGRREVGHGNLAERALIPTLPSEEEFPYTIRVESLITESHGSSSMASVCGGCLSLMDAGVPIKKPVAGIAMGMLLGDKGGLSDENALILSDITGTEDALGTMDFKVAGDRHGVTTFQLDIKCEGLTFETMQRALEQARQGRLHILDEMDKVLSAPRAELPPTVPKIMSFTVPSESLGKIIGPGGKQIRAIIEDFELTNMDVKDDGKIQVSSFNAQKMKEAEEFVMNLIKGGAGGGGKTERAKYAGPDPVEGETYTGKITGIHPFGVFVEILPGSEDGSTPGLEGLVHVSELARDRIRNCEGYIKSLGVEELTVKYLGVEKGKIRLSRKAVLEEPNGERKSETRTSLASSAPSMEEDELAVIANAVEGVHE